MYLARTAARQTRPARMLLLRKERGVLGKRERAVSFAHNSATAHLDRALCYGSGAVKADRAIGVGAGPANADEVTLGPDQAKMQRRTDRGGLEIGPFRQTTPASNLGATGRAHPNAELTPATLVEPADDRGPVPAFGHVDVSRVKEECCLAQPSNCRLTARGLCPGIWTHAADRVSRPDPETC